MKINIPADLQPKGEAFEIFRSPNSIEEIVAALPVVAYHTKHFPYLIPVSPKTQPTVSLDLYELAKYISAPKSDPLVIKKIEGWSTCDDKDWKGTDYIIFATSETLKSKEVLDILTDLTSLGREWPGGEDEALFKVYDGGNAFYRVGNRILQ